MKAHTVWVLLLAVIHLPKQSSSERRILLTSDLTQSSGLPKSDYAILNLDQNELAMTVTENSNQLFIRSATIPDPSKPNVADIKENNAVVFPYIANPANNKMLNIALTFSQERACPDYSVEGVQCSNNMTLNVYEAESDTDITSLIRDGVVPLRSYTLSSEQSNVGSPQRFNEYLEFVTTVPGVRLALLDKGSEFTVNLFDVSAFYCVWTHPADKLLPIDCPNKWATPSINSTAVCSCADVNSSPASHFPLLVDCVLHKNIPDAGFAPLREFLSCECVGGYTLKESDISHTNFLCVKDASPTSETSTNPLSTDESTATTSTSTMSRVSSTSSSVSSTTTPNVKDNDKGNNNGNSATGLADGDNSWCLVLSLITWFVLRFSAPWL